MFLIENTFLFWLRSTNGVFFLLFPFGNFNTAHFITEQISINTHLFPHLCASVFSADFKGHFTLLMTSVSDNRWKYQHIIVVFMEMNDCFEIKTCTSCWDHNTLLVFVANISRVCSSFHILYGHFDDCFSFAHA